ncbi:UdgX family uracil-DNA binding protein [Streptomyces sp. B1866]|uniref:UdgX family uracil-DNA binding protein n=1 Tax=Streptomyces sp. B1866 TaxID=3075431 RepID=UPI002891F426|nr:UdgX family uracil-DNA binding protein [Streptomyces sp. B1866]MDT3398624.1 UdgX family uracil-DNA binding protein [Streptomyces sp. B1866]
MAGTRTPHRRPARADGPEAPAPEDAYDAGPFLPSGGEAAAGSASARLAALREAAAGCRGCPLHRDATQTVFSSGDAGARIVLVGEQPGDQEDRRGQPFVGPAGRVLARALDEAGIDPTETYVTNAVKHFKFGYVEGCGKRRIHKPPSLREMTACGPWLAAELAAVDPEVVVALGATAGRALLGSGFRVTRARGVPLPLPAEAEAPVAATVRDDGRARVVATIHPSAVLRADDQEAAYRGLVSDLRVAAEVLG